MTGPITHASVKKYAEEKGMFPVQVDGVPEGFSYLEPDIEIGGVVHRGRLVKFRPLGLWEEKENITYEARDN